MPWSRILPEKLKGNQPLREFPTFYRDLTLCVPCIISNYVNKTNKMHSFYIYLFYNLYIHSTCFEQSNCSSSGVFVIYCIHSFVQCHGFLVVTGHTGHHKVLLILIKIQQHFHGDVPVSKLVCVLFSHS
jgi:hypothetical protein